jgi:DNA-binding transcriptional ArsR family regulator
MTDLIKRSHALSCDKRHCILVWLKDPAAHFPPQVHGDIVEDGVCGVYIAEKLAVSRPTASVHLNLLADAGFVRAKRIGKYTYFRRVDAALAAFSRDLMAL